MSRALHILLLFSHSWAICNLVSSIVIYKKNQKKTCTTAALCIFIYMYFSLQFLVVWFGLVWDFKACFTGSDTQQWWHSCGANMCLWNGWTLCAILTARGLKILRNWWIALWRHFPAEMRKEVLPAHLRMSDGCRQAYRFFSVGHSH